MNDPYIAHFYKDSNNAIHIQSVSEHNLNVAYLAMSNSPLKCLSSVAWVSGALHDAGKYREGVQNYLRRAMNEEQVRRGEEDHSTGGGFLIDKMFPATNLSVLIQMAVFCHHGLHDCFSFEKSTIYIKERLSKKENFQNVEERYYQYLKKEDLEKRGLIAKQEVAGIIQEILGFIRIKNLSKNMYGNRDFFLGMYERTIMSLLVDADRTDTACFMEQRELPAPKSDEMMQDIWGKCITYLEQYLKSMKSESRLDEYRRDISRKCMEAGEREERLYRLTVPTGAGKTLSSLRFGLYHARKYHKRHIIYVAPYQSIIDQNAEEIRRAIHNDEIVLEHHCNVIHDDERERIRYEILTENWDSPIIVTTAVQFLNTLFASGIGNIRRMYSILNSVIIFDEVQALPVKITKLFNLSVNFLTAFGKSTVVLCSATQPLFDELDENRLLPPLSMAGNPKEYAEVFKRTKIIDATKGAGSGFAAEELQEFIWDKAETLKQVLVVVNTKKCAESLYKEIKKKCKGSDYILFHLSTNMCAEHRRDVLKRLEENLENEKKVICISTQLIEAGVNLSFKCVIRSLAGLDNIIQAAGRCNRHGEAGMGYVYIVGISSELENVERLAEIRKMQESMTEVLNQFRKNPAIFDHSLSSEESIRYYYQIYLRKRMPEMEYLVSVNGVDVTLLDLLSTSKTMWESMSESTKKDSKNLLLKQAFKTAGDVFEVIPEDGKVDVVVRYDEKAEKQIAILEDEYATLAEHKKALRRLQPYTVGISEQFRQKLGNAITSVCGGTVYVLSQNYYSRETGVSEEPLGMEFINF